MLCPECHGSSAVTYNQHSFEILKCLRLGTLGSQNGTYNFATRASVCSTQSAIHAPPISGRLTPEFVDVTLKERECRMHSTWFAQSVILLPKTISSSCNELWLLPSTVCPRCLRLHTAKTYRQEGFTYHFWLSFFGPKFWRFWPTLSSTQSDSAISIESFEDESQAACEGCPTRH